MRNRNWCAPRGVQMAIVCATLGTFGCGVGDDGSEQKPPVVGTADRRGIGLELARASASSASPEGGLGELRQALSSPFSFTLDDRRSLFVSDESIVSQITLKDVLTKLSGSASGALTLYKKFWDLQNDAAHGVTTGAHCTGTLNGYPVSCPNLEGAQASETDPFDAQGLGRQNPEAYHAVALVNRIDLTDPAGGDCGEFRMIFGKNPQIGSKAFSRSLIIFEGVLPNPKPTLGLVGCRAVQTYWANLSNPSLSDAARASLLRTFFLDGAAGASPMVRAANYAGGNAGRIRTNQFFQDAAINDPALGLLPWVLREFVLNGSGTAVPQRVTTKENPFVGLFDKTRTDSLAGQLNDYLSRPDVVSALAVNDLNGFNYPGPVPNQLNAGESQSSPFGLPGTNTPNDYFAKFSGEPTHPLRARLQTTLTSLNSTLTPDNIVARVQSLSCGGCHLLSSAGSPQPPLGLTNADGSAHPFPAASTPFTHVDERGPAADGRFVVSAGVEEFLQFRHQVQSVYFDRTQSFPLGVGVQVTSNWSTGYCANVTLSNTTGTAYSVWELKLNVPGITLHDNWGSTASLQGTSLELLPPTFAAPVGANGSYVFGFCATKKVANSAPQVSVASSAGYHP
jgi:hypothetical protein